MRKFLILLAALSLVCCLQPQKASAIENPLTRPNNKFGIHILFDSEVEDAAKLVNTNGGDWGYITVPIQAGDRDLLKWQAFMDNAKAHHLIPIMRLATEGDYFNTKAWRKPNASDLIDFVNFLDSLNWPVKNRYVIVFNEVNRGDEWGGSVDPSEYAQLLNYAFALFKSRSQDYFILNAGMDNAAPNQGTDFMNEYTYLRAMNQAVPGIFNRLDGFTSHAYPNPGFAQPPDSITSESISSFTYETQLIDSMTTKQLPVFITETGWNAPFLSPQTVAGYYTTAFQTVWANPRIVAITPFLLRAGAGPFSGFGFLDGNNQPTPEYKAYASFLKIKGQPSLSFPVVRSVLGTEIKELPERSFISKIDPTPTGTQHFSSMMKNAIKWILRI